MPCPTTRWTAGSPGGSPTLPRCPPADGRRERSRMIGFGSREALAQVPHWRRPIVAVRRFVAELVRRCHERGRTALLRALRVTGATVAAFVVAEGVGIQNPPPLVAALTALLVVQATL